MADARSKAVLDALEPLYTRSVYLIDRVRNLREPLGAADSIEVPASPQLTVAANGANTTAPQSGTPTVLAVNPNLHPLINVLLPAVDQVQLLGGTWAPQIAEDATQQLKNSMDNALCQDYLARTLAYDTAASYHDNLAGDSLTEDDILNSKATILAQDGSMASSLALITSPFGEASITSIAGFTPMAQQIDQGLLGVPQIGKVFGIPVLSTNAVQRSLTIAGTGSITSNVATVTVAAGHGFVPGAMVYTSGFTVAGGQNIASTSAVAVQSVTATTVVFALSGTNGSIGSGSIIMRSCMNLLVDLKHIFVAQQRFPTIRVVDDYQSTSSALQVSALWGRIGRAGRCRVIHSPPSSV